ncbi:MAG: hypothetical protein LUF87_02465 [Alistipes sp.]|nr:hypothetical protein [Alistipes sp.]
MLRYLNLYLFLLLIGANAPLSGQKLIVNETLRTSGGDIGEVLSLWEGYFEHMSEGGQSLDSEAAPAVIFDDPIAYTMTPLVPVYARGNNYTFDIRRIDQKYFEIDNILYFETGDAPVVFFIYRHCAFLNDSGRFELCSYFQSIKPILGKFSTEYIDFYYPSHYGFDTKKARSTGEFIERLIRMYEFGSAEKAVYIVSNNLDECNSILGFKYSILQSHDKNAGAYIYPNIIISQREDHLHELVHLVFKRNYPDGSDFIHERVATYYGGSAGRTFEELGQELRAFIKDNPEMDLLEVAEKRYSGDPVGTFHNTLAAMVVDYTIQYGGERSVKELFMYRDISDILYICFGVGEQNISAFLWNLCK